MILYRSVSQAELEELRTTGRFRISSNSLEGKFFTETFGSAKHWGEVLGIVKVELESDVTSFSEVFPMLDGIGTAYYISYDMLETLNGLILSVTEVNDET
jgi:hypothetical protein